MRVPVAWLREYCSPDLSTTDVAERFDLTGTEVARIERIAMLVSELPDARMTLENDLRVLRQFGAGP